MKTPGYSILERVRSRFHRGLTLNSSGQATVEYILMIAVGVVFTVKVMGFFNGIFTEGLGKLEQNIQADQSTGKGFPQ